MNGVATPTLDPLLGETLRLIEHTREMIALIEVGVDDVEIDDLSRLEVVRECTRLTARLTAVLSWLLSQKAVAAGEFGLSDDRARRPLFGIGDARLDPAAMPGGDPAHSRCDALSALVVESASLFSRVARLDRLREERRHDPDRT